MPIWKFGQRAVQQLNGEDALIGAAPQQPEAGARLDGDLAGRDRVGIVKPQGPPLIQVLVVDGRGRRRTEEQH